MAKHVQPKRFYHNEQHELSRTARETGGSVPKLGEINWQSKQRRLVKSLKTTQDELQRSEDPIKGRRYYLLAKPERSVPKTTTNLKKAKSGKFDELVDYS